jgi:hypothetical protein
VSRAGVYLYCIGRSDQLSDRIQTIDAPPVDGARDLRIIRSGDLAALVSDTDIQEYEIRRDTVLAHQRVLESVMAIGDILPVSFGTVAGDDADIIDTLLEGNADHLHDSLKYIEGCVELSLRVSWIQERLFEEIVEEYDEIRALRDSLSRAPEDSAYFDRIRLGEMTSEAIAMKSEAEAQAILNALAPLWVDVVLNDATGDVVFFNASFLVDRNTEPEFDDAVQAIAEERQERMRFRYVGPLPPASFVSLVIQAEE